MAEQYFDKFSNERKLQAEQKRILKLFDEIEFKMTEMSKQGININLANSIRDIEAVVVSLQKTTAELGVVRKEYAISSAKITQANQQMAASKKELTRNDALDYELLKRRNAAIKLEAQGRAAGIGSDERLLVLIKQRKIEQQGLNRNTAEGAERYREITVELRAYNAELANRAGATTKPIADPNSLEELKKRPISSIPFTHNLDEDNKALKETGERVNELDKEYAAITMSANEWAASQRRLNAEVGSTTVGATAASGVKEYRDELERMTGSVQENEAILAIYKNELASTQAEIAQLEATTNAAQKATPQYTKRMEELRSTESRLKKEIKETNIVVKAQTVQNLEATTSLKGMEARLELLRVALNRMNKEQLASPIGQRFTAEANTLTKSIQNLKKESGQIQTSANNMSNAVTRSLGRVIGYLRNIAYLIPGIGIGGLFALAAEGIGAFATSLFSNEKALVEFKEKFKALNDALKESEFQNAVSTVEELRIEINLAKEGFISKESVVKRYNETIGKTTGEVKNLDEAEEHLRSQGDAYIKFTLLKAAANLILAKAAKVVADQAEEDFKALEKFREFEGIQDEAKAAEQKKSEDEVERLRKKLTDLKEEKIKTEKLLTDTEIKESPVIKSLGIEISKLEQRLQDIDNVKKGIAAKAQELPGVIAPSAADADQGVEENFRNAEKKSAAFGLIQSEGVETRLKRLKAQSDKKLTTLRAIAKDILDQAGQIFKDFNFSDFFGGTGGKDKQPDKVKFFDDILKKERDVQLEISKNEERNVQDRVVARDRAFALDTALVEGKRKVDLENAKGSAEDIKNINDLADRELIDLENKKTNDILNIKDKFLQDLKANAVKAKEIEKEGLGLINDDLKKEYEDKSKLNDEQNKLELESIEANYQEQLSVLNKKILKHKITQKAADKELLKIEADHQVAVLKQQVKFLNKQIELEEILNNLEKDPEKKKARQAQIDAAKEKVRGLQSQIDNILSEFLIKKTKKSKDEYVKFWEEIADAAKQAFDLIADLEDAAAEREKNRIQEKIDLLEAQRLADIELADQTITNERDKAAAIAAIDSKANAQRKVYEIEQRQAEERAARFHKASTIANIVLSTALAVIKALTEGDPLTKIPRAILAGALGAAQLAVAVATPIPKYAKGGIAKKGLGIIGEQGQELAVDKSGRLTLYDKPTLTSFVGGEKIYPNRVTEDILAASRQGTRAMAQKVPQVNINTKDDEILAVLKRIDKKPPVAVIVQPKLEATPYYLKNLKH